MKRLRKFSNDDILFTDEITVNFNMIHHVLEDIEHGRNLSNDEPLEGLEIFR